MAINNPDKVAVVSPSSGSSFSQCKNAVANLSGGTGNTFLVANSNRAYAAIVNTSAVTVSLILGYATGRDIGTGITLYPGGSYEITQSNLYTGRISAISQNDASLSYVECSF